MADGITLGTAYVQVVPSTEGISGQLSSAFNSAGDQAGQSSGKKFGSSFSSALGTAAKVGAGVITAVGASVAAVSTQFMNSAGSVASYGDSIDKMSQKLGISAEAYQEWDAVLQHSGTSIEAMKPAMKTLSSAAQSGSEAFTKLGISQEKAASMSREDLFAETITALQNVKDENERSALATKLFGKSAMELGPLLNTSAEDTQAMRDRVHELGGVMSNEAVKAAAAYQDSLQDMTTAMDGMKRNMMANFLPSITGIMDGITEILTGSTDEGLAKISESISKMIGQINTMLPKVMEVAQGIVQGLGQAIIENLPVIIETGTQIVVNLLTGIIQALPDLIKAGVEAITTLSNGITQSIPDLIPVIVDVVFAIADTLIDNAPQLLEAALQLMIGLGEGLIQAIPEVIERIPEIIAKLVDKIIEMIPQISAAGEKLLSSLVENLPTIISHITAAVPKIIDSLLKLFSQAVPKLVEVGVNLIKGIGQGLLKGLPEVIKQAKQVAGDILNSIKDFFHISSPSKVMMEFGRFLDQGLAVGIEDEADTPIRKMIGMSEDLSDAFAPKLSMGNLQIPRPDLSGRHFGNPIETVTSASRSVPEQITVVLELDKQPLGKAVFKLNNEEVQRHGVKLVIA